jgi:hypothetical protein
MFWVVTEYSVLTAATMTMTTTIMMTAAAVVMTTMTMTKLHGTSSFLRS